MILLLLGVLFIIIFLSFNLYINTFIKTDAITQLSIFSNLYDQHNNDKEQIEFEKLPDISKQPKNRTGTKVEVFSIIDDYSIQNYYENEDGSNLQEISSIASYLKENEIDLGNINDYHLETETGEFYITIIKDQKQENAFIVFYVDITAIKRFADTVNLVLIIIVLLSAVTSFGVAALIANSVTRPVKKLIDFAGQIGKGDFSRKDLNFSDREFKELSNVMNQSACKLNNYDNEQKTFFQNVSHEFRSPLMTIRCYAEGIENKLMDPEKSSRTIINEVDRLKEMVEDLLYLSQIDTLIKDIEKSENDLRETIESCAQNLYPIAEKNNIKFIYNFEKIPVLSEYNEKYMYRAINNLILNALQYAKTRIILTCKYEAKTINLSIKDDGDGIPSDVQPHIFERFYKGKDGNHGIGLSIVKSVVDLHGGRISVKSDKGTIFLIEFDIK